MMNRVKPKGQLRKLASQGWAEAFSLQMVNVLTPSTDTRLRGIVRTCINLSMQELR